MFSYKLIPQTRSVLTMIHRMVAIAAILMTIAHPGKYFPEISSRYAQKMAVRHGIKEEMAMSESPK